jgi:hypothetical protein
MYAVKMVQASRNRPVALPAAQPRGHELDVGGEGDPEGPIRTEGHGTESVRLLELPHPRQQLNHTAVTQREGKDYRFHPLRDQSGVDAAQYEGGHRERRQTERARVGEGSPTARTLARGATATSQSMAAVLIKVFPSAILAQGSARAVVPVIPVVPVDGVRPRFLLSRVM